MLRDMGRALTALFTLAAVLALAALLTQAADERVQRAAPRPDAERGAPVEGAARLLRGDSGDAAERELGEAAELDAREVPGS
jgi:hypothetical protein